jgi:hypothetical protein
VDGEPGHDCILRTRQNSLTFHLPTICRTRPSRLRRTCRSTRAIFNASLTATNSLADARCDIDGSCAKVTQIKDGRTHLADKAEHAVDLETGAIVTVTLQGADEGDTTTIVDTVTELDALGVRSYVAEPDRGRRDWSKAPEAQAPVYGNRRRIRGRRGRLMRQRSERIEWSFAHLHDTGGMRRTHLRGHTNVLKRVLIHAGAFNLGLMMRHLIGVGTPRDLQGRLAAVMATLWWLLSAPPLDPGSCGNVTRT